MTYSPGQEIIWYRQNPSNPAWPVKTKAVFKEYRGKKSALVETATGETKRVLLDSIEAVKKPQMLREGVFHAN